MYHNLIQLKMLLLTIFLCKFSLISSMSFMEYPFKLEASNRIIHASLTDKETGQVWQIEEKISSSSQRIEGKIDVTSSKLPGFVNVFYSFKPGYDNDRRLVMQNSNCDLYIYKSDWTKQFPGVTKPLTNMILLMGPSFFYRIADSQWTEGKDEVIRGALMHSASTILSQKLNVTIYYKGPQDSKIGASQPNRIVLTGYGPETLVEKDLGETLIIDIYLQSITYQELSEQVQPSPGIGCPSYLQNNIEAPQVSVQKIHFLAKDLINKTQVSLKEIHADEHGQVLRLTETHLGFSWDYLYDYNLGVEYKLSSSGDCPSYAATLKSPGISIDAKFRISSLLWLDGSFQYLGQVVFEHRSGLNAKVWESVETDKVLESGKYDKVVTTAYLIPSEKESIFAGYMFVAVTRNAYKKDAMDSFELIESIHRDFYDFDIDLPDTEYEAAFRLGDCFADPAKRLTLTLHLTCNLGKSPDCLKKGEELTYSLRESLMETIGGTYKLSPLRIVDVEFVFTRERIEADVTFVEAPNFEESFTADYQYIQTSSIKKWHETSSKSEHECLKYQSYYMYYSSGSAIVFCKDGNVCISTEHPESIEKIGSGGTYCKIYSIPLKNLYRFGNEKSLEDIHDHILEEILHEKIALQSGDLYTYEIVDVVANDKREEAKERELYRLFNSGSKLTPNGFDIIEVPNIKHFSDCYRACSKSEDIFCETFSFCEDKEVTNCFVSSLDEDRVSGNLTTSKGCMTYSKNHLTDYTARNNKAYKVPTSVSSDLWIDDCALECATSPDCFSFQYCDGFCTFGGYYTESNTKFQSGCTIYTPKLSQRYQLTGSKVVTEVLHTELDLDLDQCATFCFDYKKGDDETCQSFNYCPKSQSASSCQLTKHSVSNVKTITNQSASCHNYELITKSNNKDGVDQKDNPIAERQTVRTTGAGAFGEIMLFLFIGLIVGFVGPYTVLKIKSSSIFRRSSNDFSWSRQIVTAEEEQNEIQI